MDRHRILSISVVLILAATVAGTSLYCCFEPKDSTPANIHTSAVKYDQWDNCVIDIDSDDLFGKGYRVSDYVDLSWNGHTVTAIIVSDYVGLLTFEYFINVAEDGTLSVACQFAYGGLSVGDEYTISYASPSHRDEFMPNYFKGECTRKDWMTDKDFINYRCISTTGIGSGTLYRSHNAFLSDSDIRSDTANAVIGTHEAKYVIDLQADVSDITELIENGEKCTDNIVYYAASGSLSVEDMSVKFLEDTSYKDVFRHMADNDGPYLIFCSLGKDRTGFVITVLEALMGATYDEMFDDYARSYECLYDIKKDTAEYRMLSFMFDPILAGLHDPGILKDLYSTDVYKIDVRGYDYRADAERYLSVDLGLSSEEIQRIRDNLS